MQIPISKSHAIEFITTLNPTCPAPKDCPSTKKVFGLILLATVFCLLCDPNFYEFIK